MTTLWLTFAYYDLLLSSFDYKKCDRGLATIYCANCSHCVVFKQGIEGTKKYVLRVRCSQGMWKKKSGEEKIYKYFSIIRRSYNDCPEYDPMGEAESFIKELKKTLPVKDEIYSY